MSLSLPLGGEGFHPALIINDLTFCPGADARILFLRFLAKLLPFPLSLLPEFTQTEVPGFCWNAFLPSALVCPVSHYLQKVATNFPSLWTQEREMKRSYWSDAWGQGCGEGEWTFLNSFHCSVCFPLLTSPRHCVGKAFNNSQQNWLNGNTETKRTW